MILNFWGYTKRWVLWVALTAWGTTATLRTLQPSLNSYLLPPHVVQGPRAVGRAVRTPPAAVGTLPCQRT